MPKYKIKQGDCIERIAYNKGFFWETLWNHPQNEGLKKKREEPNVLFPGDSLFIPEKTIKTESIDTEKLHRFRKKGIPSIIRMVLLDEDDEPLKNIKYILKIDGEIVSGKTDSEGKLSHPVNPNVKKGKLIIGEDKDEYDLEIGHIDPISEINGIQNRLNNLGIFCGKIDGVLGPKTEEDIQEFQVAYGLEVTGKIDEQTKNKLKEIYEF